MTNLEKLRTLLQELFQLDQADLDFGIYRIMNQKREEVVRFLDKDLLPQVKQAFEAYRPADKAILQDQLAQAIQQANALGVDPEQISKVNALRQKIADSAVDVTALENEVFSHLTNFFRRYYSEGDFISLRRYKEGVYAIPYEGEEVKLHWANADQYYIKSSETFRDYTFKINMLREQASAPGERRVRIHLVAASTEQNNNKEAQGKERRFVLCADEPLKEENGELYIRFEYRPTEGKQKQDELNRQAIEKVLKAKGFDAWTQELGRLAPTDKNKDRTVLEKHLTQYTARNTFDYFIHKDLGGFLRRELDFYIKNEVMHLDDIEHESAPKVEQYLSQIKVIRAIAHKIIAFLEQLENFQKKLWLKKKFVVETNYCITLDRVPEELYPEIVKNDAQREEWVRLFAIDEIKSDLVSPGYTLPIKVDFLRANPFLVLDTSHFKPAFVDKLVRSLENLDESVTGIAVKSDNAQALSLLSNRFRSKVKTIYIDPPYNTGQDDFVYKDNYQRSSWVSMMDGRLTLAAPLLSETGAIFCSLDDGLSAELKRVFAERIPSMRRLGEFVWKTRNTDNRVGTNFSVDHESVHLWVRPTASLLGRVIDRSDFKNPDNDPRGPYTTDPLTGKANATDRPNLHYTIINPDTGDKYPPHPDFGWITNKEGFERLLADKRIFLARESKDRAAKEEAIPL